jgi:hypothetical protein
MSEPDLVIRADWDEEAGVWVASCSQISGLSIEAESIDDLRCKLTGALVDLFELNGPPGSGGDEPLIELVTHSHLHIPAAA